MNKIYLSDNYIVIEVDGEVITFSKKCLYREVLDPNGAFFINENKQEFEIGFSDIPTYENDNSETYTETTLREFLRTNTGFL